MTTHYCPSNSDEEKEYTITGEDSFVIDCNCPSRVVCSHLEKISRQIVLFGLKDGETAFHEVYEFLPSKHSRFTEDADINGIYYKIRGRVVTYRYLLPVRGFTFGKTTSPITARDHLKRLRELMISNGIPKKIAYEHTKYL